MAPRAVHLPSPALLDLNFTSTTQEPKKVVPLADRYLPGTSVSPGQMYLRRRDLILSCAGESACKPVRRKDKKGANVQTLIRYMSIYNEGRCFDISL